jgi:hypothetical protein
MRRRVWPRGLLLTGDVAHRRQERDPDAYATASVEGTTGSMAHNFDLVTQLNKSRIRRSDRWSNSSRCGLSRLVVLRFFDFFSRPTEQSGLLRYPDRTERRLQ